MSDSSCLGPKLTPPRGGLLRLQQAVQQSEHRHVHTRTWVAAGITASLATLAVLIVGHNRLQQHRMDVAVRQALTATPQTHFENGAYMTLPSGNPNVRILLVGSLPSQQTHAMEPLAN